MDDQLDEVLQPYQELDKTIVKIDSVFNALNITNMQSIASLKDHFVPYMWCPNCSSPDDGSSASTENDGHEFSDQDSNIYRPITSVIKQPSIN